MSTLLTASLLLQSFSEAKRELPVSPLFFGLFTFITLMLMLYLVLRLDRD